MLSAKRQVPARFRRARNRRDFAALNAATGESALTFRFSLGHNGRASAVSEASNSKSVVSGHTEIVMSHEHVLWIAVAAYGLHILEEYELNWRDWARSILHLPVEWGSFYIVNALVVVLGACCAAVGWHEPWFALGFPALMLINATFFHVLPTITTRVYSPGLATAVVLFYPVAGWAYHGAWADGVLTVAGGLLSVVFGAGLMATPIVLLKIKGREWFAYGRREQNDKC